MSAEFAPGRYILYATLACPFAARTLISRSIAGLEEDVQLSILNVSMGPDGWFWDESDKRSAGSDPKDPVQGFQKIKDVYHSSDANYSGRYTVPMLFDKQDKKVISNESEDILRLFNQWRKPGAHDIRPEALASAIDEMNTRTFDGIQANIFRAGYATTQADYDQFAPKVFAGFAALDKELQEREFLVDSQLTAADIRFYAVAIRFDIGYQWTCRLFQKTVKDYPSLHRWMVALYNRPEFAKWTQWDQVR